jgi:hypothetical protein
MLSYNIDFQIISSEGDAMHNVKGVLSASENNLNSPGGVEEKSGKIDMVCEDGDGECMTMRFSRKDLSDILKSIDGI